MKSVGGDGEAEYEASEEFGDDGVDEGIFNSETKSSKIAIKSEKMKL